MLDLHGGRSALHVRAATALAEPLRGAGQVGKKSIHGAEHERRAPELDLHLIRVHRAVIETQKAAQNRLKKRLATTATHHAVGSRHRDDVVRWNEAFCSLFSSVFFKVQQTVHKTTFYSGPPSVLNSPASLPQQKGAGWGRGAQQQQQKSAAAAAAARQGKRDKYHYEVECVTDVPIGCILNR